MPMPMRVKAVGKPSMIATTTRASIIRPRWPLTILSAASSITPVPAMMIAIRMKPNQSSLRMRIIVHPLGW